MDVKKCNVLAAEIRLETLKVIHSRGFGHVGGSMDLADLMARQAMSPVYWQETIENMIADGVELFVEIGPGTTLTGLVHKISHEVKTANVEDMESLEKTLAILKGEEIC